MIQQVVFLIQVKHRSPEIKVNRTVYTLSRGIMAFPLTITIKQWTLIVSLVAQLVKNLPAMQETLVQFLGSEDPLEKQ